MRTILVVGLLLGMSGAASATTVTYLDTTGDVGQYASLAIGADGLGLVAYQDAANDDLKIAHCTNIACTAATIATLDSAGDVGLVTQLVIGADGRGLVAYYDGTQQAVKTAHCNDLACTSAAVRVIEPAFTSTTSIGLTIGSDGLPLLAYTDVLRVHTVHCTVADCSAATISDVGPAPGVQAAVLSLGANGLGVIAFEDPVQGGPVHIRRCLNVLCSALTPAVPAVPGATFLIIPTALAVPADGRPLIGYRYSEIASPQPEVRMSRCTDATCATQAPALAIPSFSGPDVALGPGGLPWFAYAENSGEIVLRSCADAACTSSTATCAGTSAFFYLSLARGSDDRSLVAFSTPGTGLGIAHDVSDPCTKMSAANTTATEAPGAQATFTITLSAPSAETVTVDYATGNLSALAGLDYAAASGTATFLPGTVTAIVPVTVFADGKDEDDEEFRLALSNPVGAVLVGASPTATIVDADPPPRILAGHCERVEGDSGIGDCVLPVRLEGSSAHVVLVDYATADGTATEGKDYVGDRGTLILLPDETEDTILVRVSGDRDLEPHETFTVTLSAPRNATILDGVGEGTILDDDAPSLSSLELTHGSRLTADLAALPGPLADQDLYRLAQPAYSSWEIVADGVSGDVAPGLVLERLAEDNVTVLQAGVAAGTGAARTLRWQRRLAFEETRQHLRVRSTGCSTDCGAEDSYRLRAYETTVRIPRFNNTGTQGTVLLVQNATGEAVGATVDFWDPSGNLLATTPLTLAPQAVGVVNTLSLAPLVGRSGSVTITHDGPYGALAGKAVALEPASGFSFDSPMVYRPR